MSAVELVMRKLVLGLSIAQILPENTNKMLSTNNLRFMDVNLTVNIIEKRSLFKESLKTNIFTVGT